MWDQTSINWKHKFNCKKSVKVLATMSSLQWDYEQGVIVSLTRKYTPKCKLNCVKEYDCWSNESKSEWTSDTAFNRVVSEDWSAEVSPQCVVIKTYGLCVHETQDVLCLKCMSWSSKQYRYKRPLEYSYREANPYLAGYVSLYFGQSSHHPMMTQHHFHP